MAFLTLVRKRIFTPNTCFLLPRLFSSQNPDLETLFKIHDYLISSFGFSPVKAATMSKRMPKYLKSPQNPDAVRHFFEHEGFNKAEIKTIVTKRPHILCSGPEKTLAPNLYALRDMGLSASALNQIILSDLVALQLPEALPRVKFWMDFVGGKEETLVKLFKRNRGLVGSDTRGDIATKISLLLNHGISFQDIQWIVCTVPSFIVSSVSFIVDLLKRANELGFQPSSKMFAHGLIAMRSVSREALQKKMELFKSFGWSEKEFLCAVQKAPSVLHLAEDNFRAKMDFLVGEAKCDISYIVDRPSLILYSLEKRMRPRHHVLAVLESKDLTGNRKDFRSAISLTDSNFLAIFIFPHKNEIPDLYEDYIRASASG